MFSQRVFNLDRHVARSPSYRAWAERCDPSVATGAFKILSLWQYSHRRRRLFSSIDLAAPRTWGARIAWKGWVFSRHLTNSASCRWSTLSGLSARLEDDRHLGGHHHPAWGAPPRYCSCLASMSPDSRSCTSRMSASPATGDLSRFTKASISRPTRTSLPEASLRWLIVRKVPGFDSEKHTYRISSRPWLPPHEERVLGEPGTLRHAERSNREYLR